VVEGSFVAILAAGALALDLGTTFIERREARNAADHAALAAAWADCNGGSATDAANASVTRNGYPADADHFSITNTADGWRATVNTSVDMTFGTVIGIDSMGVSGTAVADCGGGSGGPNNAIYAFGNTCTQAIGKWQLDIGTQDNTIWGGVHSNGNANVTNTPNDFGPGNAPVDPFTYVSSIYDDGSDSGDFDSGYPAQVGPVTPVPPPWPVIEHYAPNGEVWDTVPSSKRHYYVGDITDADITESGLYFTEGNIDLGNSDLNMDLTLVARGSVKISGSNSILDPYIDNVLAAGAAPLFGDEQCDKFQVALSGGSNAWTGIIFAPGGLIEWSGSDNVALTGSLLGYSVRLNGSGITIIADPTLFPPAGDGAQLIE
jgi:hypothetical protein